MDEANKDATNTAKEGDRLLSHICKVLQSKVWPNLDIGIEEVK